MATKLNKLFVGNISWTVSKRELIDYFSKFGYISEATVLFDKKTGLSKGYGFVQFQNKSSVEEVLKIPNHHLEGFNLNIQPAE